MKNFYEELKSFDKFEDLTVSENYHEAPSDYLIVLTDIVESTKKILAGRYRDVNIVGAACIAAVERSLGESQVPFVFGGDGASFLIPPDSLSLVKNALCEVRNSAKENYDMILRVGIVPVSDVKKAGYRVNVAKFKLAGNKYMAKFSGGGLAYAEKLMKQTNQFEMEKVSEQGSSFHNLSCRWQPIKNNNGKILTLIVKAPSFSDYSLVLQKLNEILSGDLYSVNPIRTQNMTYSGLMDILRKEIKFERNKLSIKFLLRVLEVVFCVLIFKKIKSFLPSNLSKYVKSMETHSDFRKFDDLLRMVIDCSPSQVAKIKDYLKQLSQDQEIFYGVHESEYALMTCLVKSIKEGDHIHFIDGDSGGYAMASKALKNNFQEKAA